jgi:hypothetical protein
MLKSQMTLLFHSLPRSVFLSLAFFSSSSFFFFFSFFFLKIFMCSIVILLLAYSIDFYLIIFTTPIGVGKTSKRDKMWICQYDNI